MDSDQPKAAVTALVLKRAGRAAAAAGQYVAEQAGIPVGETAILLHHILPLLGVSIWMESGCRENDRALADGVRRVPPIGRVARRPRSCRRRLPVGSRRQTTACRGERLWIEAGERDREGESGGSIGRRGAATDRQTHSLCSSKACVSERRVQCYRTMHCTVLDVGRKV